MDYLGSKVVGINTAYFALLLRVTWIIANDGFTALQMFNCLRLPEGIRSKIFPEIIIDTKGKESNKYHCKGIKVALSKFKSTPNASNYSKTDATFY